MELYQTSYISELAIAINVLGDINIKIDKFNPKTIYKFSRENKILFIPTMPITMNNLINSNVIVKKNEYKPSDFVDVFSNPQKLNTVIQFIKQTKNIKPVTIDIAERNGIVKKNIELILSIYFSRDNKFIYNNRSFPIHSYRWNEIFTSKPSSITTKKVPLYYITIDLYVLNDKKTGNLNERNILTCEIKQTNIIKDLNELGFNIKLPIKKNITPLYGPNIRGSYTFDNL